MASQPDNGPDTEPAVASTTAKPAPEMENPKTPPPSADAAVSLPTPLPSGSVYKETSSHHSANQAIAPVLPISPSKPPRSTFPVPFHDTNDRSPTKHDVFASTSSSSKGHRPTWSTSSDSSHHLGSSPSKPSYAPTTVPYSPSKAPASFPTSMSPPATLVAPAAAASRGSSSKPVKPYLPEAILKLGQEDIEKMSSEDAKENLVQAVMALQLVNKSMSKFDTLVSQYELQNKLLTIEAHESAQRYEVENSIVKREVDRLRIETMGTNESLTEVESYKRRLRKMKSRLKDMLERLEIKDAEIERLRRRLQERVILEPIITPGPYGGGSPGYGQFPQSPSHAQFTPHHQTPGYSHPPPSAHSAQAQQTPSQYTRMPQSPTKLPPINGASGRTSQEDTGLEALEMLASQVLSQRIQPQHSPTTVATPTAYSQATLSASASKGLLSPLEFSNESPEKRRRESSASTITVVSDEEGTGEADRSFEDSSYQSPSRRSRHEGSSASGQSKGTSPGSPKKYVRKDDNKMAVGRLLDFSPRK